MLAAIFPSWCGRVFLAALIAMALWIRFSNWLGAQFLVYASTPPDGKILFSGFYATMVHRATELPVNIDGPYIRAFLYLKGANAIEFLPCSAI